MKKQLRKTSAAFTVEVFLGQYIPQFRSKIGVKFAALDYQNVMQKRFNEQSRLSVGAHTRSLTHTQSQDQTRTDSNASPDRKTKRSSK